MKTLKLNGQDLNIQQVWDVAHKKLEVQLDPSCLNQIQSSRNYLDQKMSAGEVMYGVNTGFGSFSDVVISDDKLVDLQKNLIRSHACGVGDPFTQIESRAIMLLRANALVRGHSGVRAEVIEQILFFINKDIVPVIPQQGSVGASGDLAPLAHLALALIGEGEVWSKDGQYVSSKIVLDNLGRAALELKAKEGLSLINGCQVMTAVGLLSLFDCQRLLRSADVIAALTVEALKGTRRAFHPLIPKTRLHRGEAITSKNMRLILGESSEIAESHKECGRVQDAYSLRCIPAVHGAAKDAVAHALQVLEIEANSSTDNPLVFVKEDEILSCGNFHGEPVAFQLDFLAIAMSGMLSMSECRIEKLINPAMSGLPAFLATDGGLQSGMMMVQVTAASLVSENKILSHPASVDSIPTSADKEDHVSMGTIAARKLKSIKENGASILACELLCAAQGVDLLAPLKPSGPLQNTMKNLREVVPFADEDRVFSKDLRVLKDFILDGQLMDKLELGV